MSSSPVSIVIAAYNEEKYIDNCLRALLEQLKDGDEIIVVDNNSTDRTALVARKLKVKVINEPRQGMSFARNAGFDFARNEILARTDADTIIGDGWLEAIRGFYAENQNMQKLTAITGPVYVKEVWPIRYGLHQGLTKKALNHETLVGSNEAMTKHLWEKIKRKLTNNDKDYMEDMEMAAVIVRMGGNVRFQKDMIVCTSGRWMIKNPVRSLRTWKRKMKNTKDLLGI